MKKFAYLFPALLFSGSVLAQEKSLIPAATAEPGNFYMEILIVVFIITTLIILLAVMAMLKAFKVIARELTDPRPYINPELIIPLDYENPKESKSSVPGIWTRLLGLKPLSEEKDLVMDHEFDGIVELNNPIPAWFMWLFYSTIAFAFVYLMYFHVLGIGKMQEEEYEAEMAEAKTEREAFLATSANNIDETSVKASTDAGVISEGSAIYNKNCVACHGDKGQGLVGPNLTDQYWIHGGKVTSIFKTIKYGVPEKGMISWEKTLTPKQISDVSNYIISLKGTNPANGKAPQGNKEG
ncbi:MAG: cbb3-type cytochrome c oxidase N-terminal domain-containing protein [Daejeonella sp.]